jgi:hypothetical protein
MQALKPVPVRPAYPQRSARHLELAAWASVKAAIGAPGARNPAAVARALGGEAGEVAALLLTRSAIAGATVATSGWAGTLATTGVSDFLTGLVPQSAMSQVIAAGTVFRSVRTAADLALSVAYRDGLLVNRSRYRPPLLALTAGNIGAEEGRRPAALREPPIRAEPIFTGMPGCRRSDD